MNVPPVEGCAPSRVFEYLRDDGSLVYVKARYDAPSGRTFRFWHPNGDGWAVGRGEAGALLYGWPGLAEHLREGRAHAAYLCEGESDAEAVARLGVVAFSGDAGSSWAEEYVEALTGLRYLVIVADDDEAGHAAALRRFEALRPVVDRVEVVLPAEGAKDAREHIEAGLGLDALRPFPLAVTEPASRSWLLDAADLLGEPDPGPTPWLVEDLIVDGALVACVGPWKVTKSYALLDLCIAIATGRPAYGKLAVPDPGPVVFANEESGRAALWRRLDALCRGRAIDPEELRGRLHVAANARMRLDDPEWQNELVALGRELVPRLFVFDPLARMKAPERKENEQGDMAVLIEYVRRLRDETGAAVAFVHHQGHAGEHMRGSSDLETAWETRLRWKRDGQSPLVTIESEHREAEAGEPLAYRINWDSETRSLRFDLADEQAAPSLDDRIVEWLREHPDQKTEEVAKGLHIRAEMVRPVLARLEEAGTSHSGPSGRRDALGRPIRDKVWNLSSQATLPADVARPEAGTGQDETRSGNRGSVPRPPSLEGDGLDEPPDEAHDHEPSLDDALQDPDLFAVYVEPFARLVPDAVTDDPPAAETGGDETRAQDERAHAREELGLDKAGLEDDVDEVERLADLARSYAWPILGDPGFAAHVAAAHRDGHLTQEETLESARVDYLIRQARRS